MKHTSIYQLPDRILVSPWCHTDTGLLVNSNPYIALPLDAAPVDIGRAILKALDASEKIIKHPKDWKEYSKERHSAAGVTSELAFQRNAKLVSVKLSNSTVLLEPSHNGGTSGSTKGFQGIPQKEISVLLANGADELGIHALKALQLCN